MLRAPQGFRKAEVVSEKELKQLTRKEDRKAQHPGRRSPTAGRNARRLRNLREAVFQLLLHYH